MKSVGQLFREKLVSRVRNGIEENSSVFLLNYNKVAAVNIAELRKRLKEEGADVYVSRNSLARLALRDSKYNEIVKKIEEQTAFVLSNSEADSIAKRLIKFINEHKNIKVSGGLLKGRVLSAADVNVLSELPSKNVLLSMLLSVIQSPLIRLAGALNANTQNLLSVLKQLSEKKGGE